MPTDMKEGAMSVSLWLSLISTLHALLCYDALMYDAMARDDEHGGFIPSDEQCPMTAK